MSSVTRKDAAYAIATLSLLLVAASGFLTVLAAGHSSETLEIVGMCFGVAGILGIGFAAFVASREEPTR